MKNPGYESDFLVTIFSRRKGKTFSFNLGRRVLCLPFVVLILLALSSLFFGGAFLKERREKRRLQVRVGRFEQLLDKLQDLPDRRELAITEAQSKTVAQSLATATQVAKKNDSSEVVSEVSGTELHGETGYHSSPTPASARIEDLRASSLTDTPGFRLDFKLVNFRAEPISGTVAIIASLKRPHKPRFVSYPSMELVNGMPAKLRKSVSFYIRRFKYVAGSFDFPFRYAQSFRILIYNPDERVIFDSTHRAEEVNVRDLSSN